MTIHQKIARIIGDTIKKVMGASGSFAGNKTIKEAAQQIITAVLTQPKPSPDIFITTPGDRSVGIWPVDVRISGDTWASMSDKEREEKRNRWKELFVETDFFGDSRIGVRFSDECEMCGHRKKDGKCVNKSCPENEPHED